ncbi:MULTISPECIES: lipid kinase YegS [Mangrovibacter]|uniref:Probable lipid kinase YegS-like n=1 Tax=Mangrovibacter plantisponsor TaxID=451513 RepID=A0A317Q5R1_9ENTR|nr:MULTISPECIES: lipid kinase YegS [Mangrovibacter]KEA50539.1 lipid kinase [Mangrovibacter sp. MFB070]PWW11487.1 lipid kinase YegS [Mangrovibacter plantisponsor]
MKTLASSMLILNGKLANDPILRDTIHQFRERGFDLHVRVTWEFGDAERFVNEAHHLKIENVIAGGGDGTLNEVVNGIYKLEEKSRPILGILPLGTANDFATAAGIPDALNNALMLAINGRPRQIDLVQVNRGRCFINMASGGFGTKVTNDTPETMKATFGGVSYLIHGILRLDKLAPDHCEIRSGDFLWEGDALIMGIGNGRQAGGGQLLCPGALINDGMLNLRIFTGESLVPTLLSTLARSEDEEHMIEASGSWFEIRAEHTMTFNLDGEPISGNQFSLVVKPGAVFCRLPPDCPLLK